MRRLRNDTHLWTVCTDHFFPVTPTIRDPHTRFQYEIAVNNMGESLEKIATIGDLSDDNVCRMMRYLQDLGRATRTINERRGRINTVWEWLARRGQTRAWPTVKRLPEPIRTPQAWTKEQLATLFAAVDAMEGTIGNTPARIWWQALLLVCWDTGERIGAILSIGWEHVDLDTGWLLIPAELRKGKSKDMTYRLAPDTVEFLRLMPRCSQRRVLFHWPYSVGYLWQKYGLILAAANLPQGRRDKFHRIRRSVASHFEAAGGNATNLLGHSQRATTMIYLDPKIVGAEQATDKLFRPRLPMSNPPDKAAG